MRYHRSLVLYSLLLLHLCIRAGEPVGHAGIMPCRSILDGGGYHLYEWKLGRVLAPFFKRDLRCHSVALPARKREWAVGIASEGGGYKVVYANAQRGVMDKELALHLAQTIVLMKEGDLIPESETPEFKAEFARLPEDSSTIALDFQEHAVQPGIGERIVEVFQQAALSASYPLNSTGGVYIDGSEYILSARHETFGLVSAMIQEPFEAMPSRKLVALIEEMSRFARHENTEPELEKAVAEAEGEFPILK